jgi:putative tricarboxylic transport membrane protein
VKAKMGSDPIFAAGWMAFGAAVLAASWRMDRLANLNINPWSVPGLLPGVLGALMLLFGAALLLRSLAARDGGTPAAAGSAARTWLALLLCFGYAAGLLGHGLPFWLTSAAFLFVALCAFRWLDRDAQAPPSLPRLALSSAAIALAASGAIGLLFQQVFLLNLP